MKVCYFGIYKSEYSRNRTLIKGLKSNGVEVIECNSQKEGIKKYYDLIRKFLKIKKDIDCVITGFPAQQVTVLAWFLTNKPIIFDALVSLYDSMVNDRKTVKKNSFRSWYLWLLDFFSCKLADCVLVDTYTHRKYFMNEFGLEKDKSYRLFIGSDDSVFKPREVIPGQKSNEFIVHFHGYYNPLQGLRHVIHAARFLTSENIFFNIVGGGEGQDDIIALARRLDLDNIDFKDPVAYEELPRIISKSNICLGIFGDTKKANRVIPNKVYEAIACKKPILTGRSDAVLELFENKENVMLCDMEDSEDIAEKILALKDNEKLRKSVGKRGYKLFKRKLTPKLLGKRLKSIVETNSQHA
jgi:glycosyltransferase involved in cell wall biosynthesis